MKLPHIGLLPRVLAAIALGIVAGLFFPQWAVKAFMTFNAVFGQFLGFLIPLIIVGLVAPAIADLGKGAGKMLVITVLIAYADTVLAGLLAYGTGSWLFPSMVGAAPSQVERMQSVEPYFSIDIPPMFPVMTGLPESRITAGSKNEVPPPVFTMSPALIYTAPFCASLPVMLPPLMFSVANWFT